MSTAARLAQLATLLTAGAGIPVADTPAAAAHPASAAGFLTPPELPGAAGTVLCPDGSTARLRVDLVITGPGTTPEQLRALYDAVDAAVGAVGQLPAAYIAGPVTPTEWADTPAYLIPLATL